MRKKFCIAVLSFILILILCLPIFAVKFEDVASDFWASKEISWAFERGLMIGTSATTFNPNGKTQRGQMVTILYRYAGTPTVEQVSVYSDVTSTDWYSDATIWAFQNRIMEESRLESNTMDAGEPISRAEFCTMLLMFSINSGTYVAPSTFAPFTDTDDVSDTMSWAIEWAYCHGIVNGTSATTFSPHDTLTRAAAAAMLYRYENYVNSNLQLSDEEKAKELFEYYACPFPKMIVEILVNVYGYSELTAERAVEAAIDTEAWKPFAVSKAEEFFYYISPKQPSEYDMEQYLVASLGFDFDVAQYAIEAMDIPSNFVRSEEDTKDWVSLAELEDMLFSVNVSCGTIKLNYVTNQNYYLTGLPSDISQGKTCYLDFNGESIECIFFDDDIAVRFNEMLYLSQYDLIDVGILDSDGEVTKAIKNGVTQEHISVETTISLVQDGQSAGTGVTIPSESESTGNLVWVPTNGGTKYHSDAGCSNMIDPIHVSVETAIAYGYKACGRCH